MKFKSVFILLLFAFAGFTVVYAEDTRTITDMVGRQVTVPTEIDSVLGTSPPTSEAVYMINPDTLIGLNFAFNDTNYVSEKYRNLPNVGGQQMGNTLNYETFLSMKPDIILFGSSPGTNVSDTIDDMQRKLYPIPVVGVIDATNAKEYGPGIIFLGDLLDQKEKASELNTF